MFSAKARELLGVAEPLIEKKLHPTLIVLRARMFGRLKADDRFFLWNGRC